MATAQKSIITVQATINAPVEKVWKFWTGPEHIVNWNNASDDWHTPRAENDLRAGGRFLSRMEARDGSSGFDFAGKYTTVEHYRQIEYVLDDGRNVQVIFIPRGNVTTVTEAFEAEQTNTTEMQEAGWQAILDNFKKYTEASEKKEIMHFKINIDAKAEKVYQYILDDKKYSDWTSVFNPSSHYIGSWEKGSKILFLGTDSVGRTGGMVSRIKENIPGRFVSIEHYGVIKDGSEIFCGPEVDQWAGALENYTFTGVEGTTLLKVDVDVHEDYVSYFAATWPEALKKLKEICEKQV
jgi:uncharacterized protein YndB with AHSA1/START domain